MVASCRRRQRRGVRRDGSPRESGVGESGTSSERRTRRRSDYSSDDSDASYGPSESGDEEASPPRVQGPGRLDPRAPPIDGEDLHPSSILTLNVGGALGDKLELVVELMDSVRAQIALIQETGVRTEPQAQRVRRALAHQEGLRESGVRYFGTPGSADDDHAGVAVLYRKYLGYPEATDSVRGRALQCEFRLSRSSRLRVVSFYGYASVATPERRRAQQALWSTVADWLEDARVAEVPLILGGDPEVGIKVSVWGTLNLKTIIQDFSTLNLKNFSITL